MIFCSKINCFARTARASPRRIPAERQSKKKRYIISFGKFSRFNNVSSSSVEKISAFFECRTKERKLGFATVQLYQTASWNISLKTDKYEFFQLPERSILNRYWSISFGARVSILYSPHCSIILRIYPREICIVSFDTDNPNCSRRETWSLPVKNIFFAMSLIFNFVSATPIGGRVRIYDSASERLLQPLQTFWTLLPFWV